MMNKRVVLETRGLKQYFPTKRKLNNKKKMRELEKKMYDYVLKNYKLDLPTSLILAKVKRDRITNELKDMVVEYLKLKKEHKTKLFVKANDGISLKIHSSETVGIVGESGCGKSTYGRSLLKLYTPTAGKIYLNGRDITKLSNSKMRKLRTKVQMIFQDPYSSLDPRMTVGNLIGEAVVEHKMFRRGSKKLEQYILEVMRKCGLSDYMVHRFPHEFSGGQRQRIGIARALALKPEFIVCDEAVSALDVSIQSQVINLLNDLQKEFGFAYLFISHDLSVVKHISDRIGVMYLGDMVELAPTDALFGAPMHPYTQALLSAIPVTDLEALRNRKRILLEGDIPSNVIVPPGCKFHTRCPIAKDICKREIPKWEQVGDDHYVACHFKGEDIV